MTSQLTADQITRVKATAPVFAEHGAVITKHFYQRMFKYRPELRNLFNQTHQANGSQSDVLARAVYAYAANIDNLGALGSAVGRITQKHASLNIRPEHYPIVGEHLLASVVEVLGDAVDEATLEAWRVAYAQLSAIMIGAEAKLYEGAAWSGYRPFIVARKEVESDEITSFYLTPADAPKEVPLGDAPKEVPLGGAPKEVPLGDAPQEVPRPEGNPLGRFGDCASPARISARTSSMRARSTRSIFVSAIAPCVMPSNCTIARCSRVCGITPSSAAITISAKSIPHAPAAIVCTSFSWPGTSMKPSTSPFSSGKYA
jgi:hemoglobin-like flavoprotein